MSDDKAFWREIHKALDIVIKAIVRYKLSGRESDQERKRAV